MPHHDQFNIDVEQFAGETVLLQQHYRNVHSGPKIYEGVVSEDGETIHVTRDKHGVLQSELDTAEIMVGCSVYDGAVFALYNPETYRAVERWCMKFDTVPNIDSVTPKSELPEPSHTPVTPVESKGYLARFKQAIKELFSNFTPILPVV